MRFPCFLVAAGILALAALLSNAEDLTTLDGKKYADITDISKYPKQVFFTSNSNRIGIAVTNLPDDFDERHGIVTANILLKKAKAGDADAMIAVGDDLFRKWQKEFSVFLATNIPPIDPNTGFSSSTINLTNSLNFWMSMDWYKKAALMGNTTAMWRIVTNDFSNDFKGINPDTGLIKTKEGSSWLRELAKRGDLIAIQQVNDFDSPRHLQSAVPNIAPDLEVLDLRAKVTHTGFIYWQWSYQLKVRNNTSQPIDAYHDVLFLDAEGFIIDKDLCKVKLSGGETKTFLGTATITPPGAERVKTIKFE